MNEIKPKMVDGVPRCSEDCPAHIHEDEEGACFWQDCNPCWPYYRARVAELEAQRVQWRKRCLGAEVRVAELERGLAARDAVIEAVRGDQGEVLSILAQGDMMDGTIMLEAEAATRVRALLSRALPTPATDSDSCPVCLTTKAECVCEPATDTDSDGEPGKRQITCHNCAHWRWDGRAICALGRVEFFPGYKHGHALPCFEESDGGECEFCGADTTDLEDRDQHFKGCARTAQPDTGECERCGGIGTVAMVETGGTPEYCPDCTTKHTPDSDGGEDDRANSTR
jgi:hypothetical protein